MKDYIVCRIIKEAEYIIQTKNTVRQAAKHFGYSKSTIHKDVAERLKEINSFLADEVKKVLEHNLEVRHIRGGEATKLKYSTK